MCTLVEGRSFKTFERLKQEFGLENKDRFRYFQLRVFYEKGIKRGIIQWDNAVLKVFTDAYKHTPTKIVSKLYNGLQNHMGDDTLYVKSKWEKEMNVVLSKDDWQAICITQQTTTSSNLAGKMSSDFLSHHTLNLNVVTHNNIVGGNVEICLPVILIFSGHVSKSKHFGKELLRFWKIFL